MSPNDTALRLLVADAQQGDLEAFDRLVRLHQRWLGSVVFAIAGKADRVDDIQQQVWAKVVEQLHTVQDTRRLKSWLYRIAKNTVIDDAKSHQRKAMDIGLEPDAVADRQTRSPLRLAMGRETHNTLLEAVRALPGIYREPFVLRHLEDWRYSEIAEVLEIPVPTVETRLVRARRMLRETLKDKI